jgi:hypothetical protein
MFVLLPKIGCVLAIHCAFVGDVAHNHEQPCAAAAAAADDGGGVAVVMMMVAAKLGFLAAMTDERVGVDAS